MRTTDGRMQMREAEYAPHEIELMRELTHLADTDLEQRAEALDSIHTIHEMKVLLGATVLEEEDSDLIQF